MADGKLVACESVKGELLDAWSLCRLGAYAEGQARADEGWAIAQIMGPHVCEPEYRVIRSGLVSAGLPSREGLAAIDENLQILDERGRVWTPGSIRATVPQAKCAWRSRVMIDLYTWTTPNGRKISIFLEETGLKYKVVPVDLEKGDQQGDEFVALNPNQKIPAIVDHDVKGDPISVFESGAILIYLAEKTGTFLPTEGRERAQVMQWLMYQMSHVGPMIGQAGHFVNSAPEPIQYAIERFVNESLRIVGVLNTGLEGREYLAGQYSIADMATYPWVMAAWGPFTAMMPDKIAALGNVQAWLDRLGAREAVQRGMAVPPSA